MAALEIATFWGGELLFLDYPKRAPAELRLGWTHDGNVWVHAQWVPDSERLAGKSAPWGELASAIVIAIVLHVGLLGLGQWVHESDPEDAPPNVRTLGTLAGDVPFGGGSEGTQENGTASTPTPAPARSIGKAAADPTVGPEESDDSVETASRFGMIGLLAGVNATDDGKGNGWGRATGDLFGRDVPALGPELSGTGMSGGGKGEGIELGGIGTIGASCDDACIGSRFGHGAMRGHYATVVCHLPVMTPTVKNHVPSEVIQRIVRQNMGRFRGCYEDGLARNPSLAGRVEVKFMIARTGDVASAQDSGSTLPDSAVVACIVRAYQTISFPSSESAIGVTYPLELTPD